MSAKRLTNEEFLERVNRKQNNEWRLIIDEDIEKVQNGEIEVINNNGQVFKNYQKSTMPMSLFHQKCGKIITKASATKFIDQHCPFCNHYNIDILQRKNEKMKQTNLERYGYEHPLQNKEIQEKMKQTNLKRYGCKAPAQNKEIQEKMKQTNLKRYGCKAPAQNKEIQEKMKQTNLKRYGCKNPMQNLNIQQKTKQTNLEKYGCRCSLQNPEVKEKAKQAYMNNHYTTEQQLFHNKKTLEEALIKLNKKLNRLPYIDEILEESGYNDNTTLYDLGLKSLFYLYQIRVGFSKAEEKITNFLSDYAPIEQHNRSILNGQELDIYIPEKSIAIEYAGMYWHGSSPFSAKGSPKSKDYHFNKYQKCLEKGIHLITLYESEWENNPELIKKKLLQYIGVNNSERIHARKCEIKEIKIPKIATEFLNQFHTQGKANASFRCGAYYQDKLIAVMQFGKNFRSSDNGIELNRFAIDTNYRILGIFTKMLKWSIEKWDIKRLYSYADHRWVSPISNVYLNNGWMAEKIGKPDYCYYNMRDKVLYHKSHYQKKSIAKLLPDYYDSSKTEFEMMDQINYIHRIYDCGKTKYILNI